jgi:heptaprenyl diphosphate synthase
LDNITEKIFSQVKREMLQVNQLIIENTNSKGEMLSEVTTHFFACSGKKIRPALVLLTGKCCKGNSNKLVHLAAALELIHAASLVHDDIIDKASMRRGKASVNAKWGIPAAVLLGDFFYARALKISAPLGKKINSGLANLINELVEGEFHQLYCKVQKKVSESDYLDTISSKTARFISLCCRLGAEVAQASNDMTESLAQYGFYTGMAFQIKDDISDLIIEKGKGKKPFQDLKNGIITLPLIHAINRNSKENYLLNLIKKEQLRKKDIMEILELINKAGSFEYSTGKVREYINLAKNSLDCLPAGKAREALGLLAECINT